MGMPDMNNQKRKKTVSNKTRLRQIFRVGCQTNIQFCNQSGSTCDELKNFGSSNGFFDWPYGVVYGHKNELYVADAKNMRVQVRQPGTGWSVHSVYKHEPIGLAVCPSLHEMPKSGTMEN